MVRRLRLSFADAAVFREEYERNIVNGGAFIRTAEEFEVRELVEVALELDFCGDSVVLEAEIVHSVRAEQAGSEAAAGVAVQFLESAAMLRDTLQRFIGEDAFAEADVAEPAARALFNEDDVTSVELEEVPEQRQLGEVREGPFFDPSEVDLSESDEEEDPFAAALDRRKAPRVRARVQARVDANSVSLEGRTRDLSQSGALISADASGLPIGKAVKLELVHPETGEQIEVEGTVSRHIETEGTVAAVGVEFGPGASGDGVNAFLDDVNQTERERQRTGIYGAIGELGMAALVRMFAINARRGTLTVIAGVEDGSIGFENGILRHVQLGEVRGVKALSRFLSWERGSFEFHARLEPADAEPVALAVEEAIQEAIRQREELIRAELNGILDPTACYAIDAEALHGESGLTKTEEAVLDLVAARFSVRRILDVIPQPDADVIEALKNLLDGEIIRPV
jgi:Tfp pilus assembly protein PilZ